MKLFLHNIAHYTDWNTRLAITYHSIYRHSTRYETHQPEKPRLKILLKFRLTTEKSGFTLLTSWPQFIHEHQPSSVYNFYCVDFKFWIFWRAPQIFGLSPSAPLGSLRGLDCGWCAVRAPCKYFVRGPDWGYFGRASSNLELRLTVIQPAAETASTRSGTGHTYRDIYDENFQKSIKFIEKLYKLSCIPNFVFHFWIFISEIYLFHSVDCFAANLKICYEILFTITMLRHNINTNVFGNLKAVTF